MSTYLRFITLCPSAEQSPALSSSSEPVDLAGVLDAARQRDLVLIVEDDFLLRTSIADFLTANEYDVESAADGLEALMRLDSAFRKPRVILMDMTMPRMDGLRFRVLQQSLPGVADIPVIAITGSARARKSNLSALGFRETFFKPLHLPKLLQTIRAL